MKELNLISLDELTDAQAEGGVSEFWNVLTDEYYTGELIPTSRRVPLDTVGREAAALDKDADIVVYCSGPDCPQSKAAGEKLAKLGFTNVRVFEGGLEAWKGSNRPVEKSGQAAA